MQGQNLLEWMCPFQKKTKRVITTAEYARNWFFGKKLTKDSKSCGKMLAENQKKVGFSSQQHGDNTKVWVIISRSSSRHVDELRYREPENPLEEVAQECVQDQEKESSTRWKVRRPYGFYGGCSFNLTSVSNAGPIAGGREGRETRHTVFFTPLNPWSSEEEYCGDPTRPRKVHCKTGWKHSKNAVYCIHLGRAQKNGIAFCQTKSHATGQCHLIVLNEWSHNAEKWLFASDPQHQELSPCCSQKSLKWVAAATAAAGNCWQDRVQKVFTALFRRSCGKLLAGHSPRLQAWTMLRKKKARSSRSSSSWSVTRRHLQRRGGDDRDAKFGWQAARRISRQVHHHRLETRKGVSNVFSEESKRKLKEMGNIELYELGEPVRTTQCLICLKHSKEGTKNCGCGKCLMPSQEHEDTIRKRIDILAEPRYVKRGRQGQRHGHEEWQHHHWKPADVANNCKKRGYTPIAGRWRDEASYRYTQQYHGWSLEYCLFLDFLKEDPDNAQRYSTQGKRLPCRSHFTLKWKNPTHPGNVSIHANYRDAMKQRATMAHQGQGHAYVPPQVRIRQRPTHLQLRSQIRDLCQQWSHIRGTQAPIAIVNDMVEFATLWKSSTEAGVAKRRMARSAMVGEMVNAVALSLHLVPNILHIRCKNRLQTFANVVHATGWRQNTSHIFLVARRIGSRLDESSQHVCRVLTTVRLLHNSAISCLVAASWACLTVILLFLTNWRRNRDCNDTGCGVWFG